jgi:hypothetical protein
LWVIAGLSLIGTLLCVAGAVYGFWISHHMEVDGVTTQAVVTRADGDDVTVDFTTEDGESVTAEIFWWPADVPAKGEKPMITYDPDDVTYAVAEGSIEDRVLAIGFAVAAAVGLLVTSGAAVGAILIHRARSRNSRAPAAPSQQ